MVRETGSFVSQYKNKATVQMIKGHRYKGHNLCEISEAGHMQVVAPNRMEDSTDNRVEIKSAPGNVIVSTVLIFILAIVMMVIGYFSGAHILHSIPWEGPGIFGSMASLGLSLLALKAIDRKFGHSANPAVIVNRVD